MFQPEKLEPIEVKIREAMTQNGVPGLSVGIIFDGEIVYTKGFGIRRREPELPFTPDSLYAIASTSKIFASVATLILHDQG